MSSSRKITYEYSIIRSYRDDDYEAVIGLYLSGDLYGGVFDEARDSREVLAHKIQDDSEAIFVAEDNEKIVGTISFIEDGRVAWLYRFAVLAGHEEAAKLLEQRALEVLKGRGHKEVLVYSDPNSEALDNKYQSLGYTKGNDYTCYYKSI